MGNLLFERKPHMGENCCLCFPIECGVKFLGFLVILGAIGGGANAVYDPNYFKLFWPELSITVLMALTFLYSFVSGSEESRKHTLFVWVFAVIVAGSLIYGWHIIGGGYAEFACTDDKLQERNDGITELEQATGVDLGGPVTYDQCVSESRSWLYADWVWRLLINCYFASVLRRWSQNDEGFSKH